MCCTACAAEPAIAHPVRDWLTVLDGRAAQPARTLTIQAVLHSLLQPAPADSYFDPPQLLLLHDACTGAGPQQHTQSVNLSSESTCEYAWGGLATLNLAT